MYACMHSYVAELLLETGPVVQPNPEKNIETLHNATLHSTRAPLDRFLARSATTPNLCASIIIMEQFLDPIKDFFRSNRHPKAQEFIRLRFLGRLVNSYSSDSMCTILTCDYSSRSKYPVLPDIGPNDGDSLECGAQLAPSRDSLASLYSLLLFFKIICSAWDDRFPGWRSGIAGFTIFASIMLILNISTLTWTATHLDDGYYATLAVGSYESISNLSGRIHFGTDILSTALLAGSNYCMQCLSSPTRAEVDVAHARGSYLSIGILSLRNILASRKRRIFLLSLLTLSSVFMHPM